MKIVIQHKSDPHTGKGNFVSRLIPELKRWGCQVTGDVSAKADIALHIGRVHYKSKATKNVLRVGPACIDTNKKWSAINHEKAKSIKQSDAVVYQSGYSRDIYHALVGRFRGPEAVIFNGASPGWTRPFSMHESPYKYNILTSTRRWWPQKRLKWTIRAFQELDRKDARLWIAGDYSMTKWHKHVPGDGRIKFLGLVGQGELARLHNLCNCMVHIVYVDACPNSVVEGLVAGLPVICTDQGGTKELVKQNGIVLEDKLFRMRAMNLNKPPHVNVPKLAEAINGFLADERFGLPYYKPPKWLYIDNIAKQYLNFFEKVLSKK